MIPGKSNNWNHKVKDDMVYNASFTHKLKVVIELDILQTSVSS